MSYRLPQPASVASIADASLAEIGRRIGRLRAELDELMADTVSAIRLSRELRAMIFRDHFQRIVTQPDPPDN